MFVSSGSSGIRGIVNDGFCVELALHMGKVVGQRYGGVIAVASDTRTSGASLKDAVSAGLMSVGSDVVDLGVVPTPALQYYVKEHANISGGIMVTASHNPASYNGVKAISAEGLEDPFLADRSVEEIMAIDTKQVAWKDIGEKAPVIGYIDDYIDAIVGLVDSQAIRDAGLKVCVECANGAAQVVVPLILRELDVSVVMLNNSEQGELTGQDSELTAVNLEDLGHMTVKTGCDFGVAFDVDSDRCLFTDETGAMVPGDCSLAILAKSLLAKKHGKVVTSVATSSSVEDAVAADGGIVKYVAVGAPNIVRKVMEYEALMGGEVNGGVVFPELQYCRDAQMAFAKMLEVVALNGPLSKLRAEIPSYAYGNASVPCPQEMKGPLLEHFRSEMKDGVTDITDGVKLFYDDGWVLVRASATGPVFRVYSQSTDPGMAQARLDDYVERALGFLGQ